MDPDTLRTGHGDVLTNDGALTNEGHWPTTGHWPRRRRTPHVGLTNVDHRLRAAFGNDYGLVVETAVGAGTKVVMRVPKFRAGVRV